MGECILGMCGINKSSFSTPVLKNAQLEVLPGEAHVLLRENGAGKSTLIKILSGVYGREGGDIWLDGRELAPIAPKKALSTGINVIYQEFNLVPDSPIYENIFIGKEYEQGILVDHKRAIEKAEGYMRRVGLEVSPRTLVHELGAAQKQLVEIAKAISNRARILVLDESTAAITDKETNMLFGITRELQKEKIGIIYISRRMSGLFKIGDRCTVIRDGEHIGTVRLSESSEDELIKMMVGRTVSFEKVANEAVNTNQIVLKVGNLRYKNLLKGVSFELHKGEVLGFAGLVDTGKTEAAKCTIGTHGKNGGTVIYKDETLSSNPSGNIERGIVYLNEDREDEGLVLIHSVMDNIALPSLKRPTEPFIRKKEMADCVKDYIKSLWIKTHTHLMEAGNLSGGSQQKVAIAKRLYSNADVYIFDEPTRGIDVGARDEICNIMYNLVNQGAPIIMISPDLAEILKMCDRVAVMREDVLEAVLDNDPGLTQETILKYAMQGGIQVWRATKMVLRQSCRP